MRRLLQAFGIVPEHARRAPPGSQRAMVAGFVHLAAVLGHRFGLSPSEALQMLIQFHMASDALRSEGFGGTRVADVYAEIHGEMLGAINSGTAPVIIEAVASAMQNMHAEDRR